LGSARLSLSAPHVGDHLPRCSRACRSKDCFTIVRPSTQPARPPRTAKAPLCVSRLTSPEGVTSIRSRQERNGPRRCSKVTAPASNSTRSMLSYRKRPADPRNRRTTPLALRATTSGPCDQVSRNPSSTWSGSAASITSPSARSISRCTATVPAAKAAPSDSNASAEPLRRQEVLTVLGRLPGVEARSHSRWGRLTSLPPGGLRRAGRIHPAAMQHPSRGGGVG